MAREVTRKSAQSEALSSHTYRLPLALEARLAEHCAAYGDIAADVVTDAVAALLDELEPGICECADEAERVMEEVGAAIAPATVNKPAGRMRQRRGRSSRHRRSAAPRPDFGASCWPGGA